VSVLVSEELPEFLQATKNATRLKRKLIFFVAVENVQSNLATGRARN